MIESKTIDKAFTSEDLSSYLGISARSLDRYRKNGQLTGWRAEKIGKHVRFFPVEQPQEQVER